jgi:hypothetical protein
VRWEGEGRRRKRNEEKRRKIKRKKETKGEKKQREKRERVIMDMSTTFTQPGETVLPNVSTKRIQLPRRIHSTSTAIAGAATALPNGPL